MSERIRTAIDNALTLLRKKIKPPLKQLMCKRCRIKFQVRMRVGDRIVCRKCGNGGSIREDGSF